MACSGDCEEYKKVITNYFESLYDMLDCKQDSMLPDCDACKKFVSCVKWNRWRDSHNNLKRIADGAWKGVFKTANETVKA